MNSLGTVPVGGHNPVRVMGIINASPESFYKKSVFTEKRAIAKTAKQMEEDGADFIDIGGMSTAPYLKTLVSENKEIERITNAIEAVQKVSRLPISIDTCRASVAEAALDLATFLAERERFDEASALCDEFGELTEKLGWTRLAAAFTEARRTISEKQAT